MNLFDRKIYIIYVKLNGLKINLKIGVSIQCFDDVRNKFISANCIVTWNVLTGTDENHKQCIFPISPINVPQSCNTIVSGRI